MYPILEKRQLNETTYLMKIKAPRVASSGLPGQFVITINTDQGERIPLTIMDVDKNEGSVTIVVQNAGASTRELVGMNVGDALFGFVGPLGHPSDILEMDDNELADTNFVFVAGGVGAAPIYPQVKYLTSKGKKVDVILGARNASLIILEKEFLALNCNLYICTDDGSKGYKGNAAAYLKELVLNNNKKYNHAVVIGPMIMMKFTSLTTKELGIKTVVSLNPLMVDGTGMCGACRVLVDGKVKFACVDGPEFDGHLVDYDQAMKRSRIYKNDEERAKLKLIEGETHHGGCGNCEDK